MAQALPPWIQPLRERDPEFVDSYMAQRERIMRDGAMDLFATGRYLDVLVEVGDALRFRERVVVCDSNRIDTLLAIPI